MYIEKHLPLLTSDIEQASRALEENMPDQIRAALEGELRRLQQAQAILMGVEDKSLLHQLRARLRWARMRIEEERDPAKKKTLQAGLKQLETQIKHEATRRA
jgi:hypothetical protein